LRGFDLFWGSEPVPLFHSRLQFETISYAIPNYLRPHQVAKLLQIKPHWIYDRICNGTIKIKKDAKYKAYLFPDQPATLEQFKRLIRDEVKTLAF